MEDFRRQPDIERRFGAPPRPFLPLPSNQPTLDTTAGDPHLDIPTLVRKYMLLALMLTILGASAGFVAVAFFPPTYKSRVVLEVQPANSAVLRIPALESDGGQIDLQTEAQVLLSSSFLQKVLLIFDSASPPPIPSRSDIFSAIRRRLRVGAYDEVPAIIAKEGLEGKVVPKPLAIAIRTLSVRPVPFTRVLEIS